jgi:hypothetical protein
MKVITEDRRGAQRRCSLAVNRRSWIAIVVNFYRVLSIMLQQHCRTTRTGKRVIQFAPGAVWVAHAPSRVVVGAPADHIPASSPVRGMGQGKQSARAPTATRGARMLPGIKLRGALVRRLEAQRSGYLRRAEAESESFDSLLRRSEWHTRPARHAGISYVVPSRVSWSASPPTTSLLLLRCVIRGRAAVGEGADCNTRGRVCHPEAGCEATRSDASELDEAEFCLKNAIFRINANSSAAMPNKAKCSS